MLMPVCLSDFKVVEADRQEIWVIVYLWLANSMLISDVMSLCSVTEGTSAASCVFLGQADS